MSTSYRYPSTESSPAIGTPGAPAPNAATEVAGVDGAGNLTPISTDSSGNQNVNVVNTIVTSNASNGTIGAVAPTVATQVGGQNPSGDLEPLELTAAGALKTDGSAVTQPVSATALPLPAGASTSAAQETANTSLTSIATNTANIPPQGQALESASTPVVLPATQITALTPPTTVTVLQPTGTNLHSVVDSSALPAGASTSALQTSGNASLATLATNLPPQGQALSSASTPVVLPAAQITALTPLSSVTVTQGTGTNLHTVVDSSALPTGAATSSNQTLANTTLNTIATNTGNIPPLGQALAAASVPVVLTSAQISTLTPLTSVTVTQATGTNLHTVIDSLPALPAGTNLIGTVKAQESTPTALTVTQAAITVGTTAVRLTVSGSAPASTRVSLVGTPDIASAATFYIGSSTVTNSGATRGIEIVAGQSFIANNDAGDYWIVSSTASQTVTILEQA